MSPFTRHSRGLVAEKVEGEATWGVYGPPLLLFLLLRILPYLYHRSPFFLFHFIFKRTSSSNSYPFFPIFIIFVVYYSLHYFLKMSPPPVLLPPHLTHLSFSLSTLLSISYSSSPHLIFISSSPNFSSFPYLTYLPSAFHLHHCTIFYVTFHLVTVT